MGVLADSELSRTLYNRLGAEYGAVSAGKLAAEPGFRATSEAAKSVGEFLARHSFNAKAGARGLFSLGQHSGTATHTFVKDVGHFFGKSFKPWEAVKWTRIIGNAGRFLSVAGVFLQVFFQAKEDRDAKDIEEELRKCRTGIRDASNEVAKELEAHFDRETKSFIAGTYGQASAQIDRQLYELRAIRQCQGELVDVLMVLLEDTRELIGEMHGRPDDPRPSREVV